MVGHQTRFPPSIGLIDLVVATVLFMRPVAQVLRRQRTPVD
jgi:hypothetical protein